MITRKRYILGASVLVFFGTLLMGLYHPPRVQAASPLNQNDIEKADYKFIDRAHIQASIGGTNYTFLDKDIGDTEYKYEMQGSDCDGSIVFANVRQQGRGGTAITLDDQVSGGNITPQDVDIDYKRGGVGQCTGTGPNDLQDSSSKINVSTGGSNYRTWYEWVDSTLIRRVDGDSDWLFSQTKDPSQSKQLFIRTAAGGACGDYIVASGDFRSHKMYRLEGNKQNGRDGLSDVPNPDRDILRSVFPSSCELWGTRNENVSTVDYQGNNIVAPTYALGSVDKADDKPGPGGGGGGPGGTIDGDENITCEARVNNPLSWILCPVFNGVADLADWLFTQFITPFLQSSPVSTDSNDPTFKIWSGFRIYGNLMLVIAMIVIVFGQTIGGGVIDAYTAKKVMPRILAAAILINLSVYIVALMVDLTNILGKGIGELMLAPIKNSVGLGLDLSASQSFGALGLGALGAILGAAGIAGTLGALLFGGTAAIQAALFVGLLVLLPVILGIIGVFVTLIIRRGLILFLIIISPFAFALYCLPNTEQYFRKWWELLFKTLLVYPIVVIIFAIADIMAVTILKANGVAGVDGQINNVLAGVVAFVLQFLPLLLIPWSFKFAGGAIASINAAITGGAGKLNGMFEKRKEYAKKDWRAQTLSARDRQYRNLGSYADRTNSRFGRGLARFAQSRVGGYNLEEAIAAQREAESKLQDLQNNNGDDTEQRALTVNKAWALAQADGENKHWRINDKGQREFRTLGGAWVSENAVDNAQARWGNNQMALQWSLGHEMDKAASQEEQDYLVSNYGRLVGSQGGFAMNDTQAQGVWKGAGFQKQNVNRQWKHYGWKGAEAGMELDGLALMKEIDEKQGNYQMLMQNADTWTTMSEEVRKAKQVVDGDIDGDQERAREILQRAARVAHATRSASFGGGAVAPVGADGAAQPLPVPTDDAVDIGGGQPGRQGGGRAVGAGAPGRVMEEANAFVEISDMFAGPYQAPAVPEESLNRRQR